jgi:uncharacterized protein (DUF2336 family)
MATFSVIPELDDIVKNGTPEKRADAVARIAGLFLEGAPHFASEHVGLFDDILLGLLPATSVGTRAELAGRLAALENAPPTLINTLGWEDDISIAGPVLTHSPLLDDMTLIDIARAKGQPHLAAICGRASLSPLVTDVIVGRGDRDVVRIVARNAGAAFSENGYAGLIKRATDDGMLALTVGLREDISPLSLKELLSKSAAIVRRRLFETARPRQRVAISQAMNELAPHPQQVKRDFAPAQATVLALHRDGKLNEAAVFEFAKAHKYEEAVASLAVLSGVRLSTVDHLVLGDRHDPILILGRAVGFKWACVRALIVLRLGPGKTASPPDIAEARINFERLSSATAQRVLAFWRTRGNVRTA